MGYREVNWSLPREQQVILDAAEHLRRHVGEDAEHGLDVRAADRVPGRRRGGHASSRSPNTCDALRAAPGAELFGAGVQACYRGPRLYDTDGHAGGGQTWVDFYKAHRDILDSDIIHVRRPDGRDIDCILHVNPRLREKGLAMIYNPLDHPVTTTVRLPLYYTGLETTAGLREKDGPLRRVTVDRQYVVTVPVTVPGRGLTWLTLESWVGTNNRLRSGRATIPCLRNCRRRLQRFVICPDPGCQARPANSRVSVWTLTFSPSLMKSGTRISMPVSSVAAFVTLPLAVSPRMPGSV